MKSSKLIRIMQCLENEDLRQIFKFLNSPFFTSNKNLLNLFQILRRYHPDYKSISVEKEKLYSKLFPNKTFSATKLRNLMSELSALIEEYLIIDQIKEDSFSQNKYLARAYAKRNQKELNEKEIKKQKEMIEQSPFQDVEHYNTSLQLIEDTLKATRSTDVKKRLELLLEKNKTLELHYQLSKIQLTSEFRSSKNILSIPNQEASKWAAQHLEKENLIYQLYQATILLHEKKKEMIFVALKNKFTKNIQLIPPLLQNVFLSHLINFAIGEMKKDDERFNPIVLELYILGLDHSMLIYSNIISDTTFFNIVVSAAKEKKFDWCKQFIMDYTPYLSLHEKEDTIALSHIYLYYYQEKFSKAIDLINQYTFSNAQKRIAARTQAIRCYYELFLKDRSYFDIFIDQSFAYEKFIRRNEPVGEAYKTAIFNFAQFLRKLAKEKLKGRLSADSKNTFVKSLEHQDIIISRSWLLKKIED